MEIAFDLTIMTLLVVTIVYATSLNKKLNLIRNHRAELKSNIESFYDATEKATKAVKDLQNQGEKIAKDINNNIAKARTVADEIDFLLSRTNKKIMELKEEIDSESARGEYKKEVRGFEARKLGREAARKPIYNFNNLETFVEEEEVYGGSLAEAELVKALRDKQYKDALAS
ncbi:MAG: hypothetical protein COV36_06880 [Alphaproteobacteria bacterium CG11_big_fil_rev_8_21_14_0_20_44_7]|nr:MAG: hypothetical protein COV36_06880 [Alphaproteobacteria bacterium CG11_big_fil_rev_8_21_14_0_20_44_7]